ncbi:MAG: hypothetical protein Q7S33_05075 [Nanoarchaeota archaeon]|nr:hypothetical protein [Nanoarchaeota archaeon]
MKFKDYATIGLLTCVTASGCSAPIIQKDNFPVGTPVYSITRANADSIMGYQAHDTTSSTSLRNIVGEKGIDTILIENRFAVKQDLADSLKLKTIFPKGYNSKIIESDYKIDNKDSVNSNSSAKKPQLMSKPNSTKTLEAKTTTEQKWYTSNWFKFFVAPSLALTSVYFISDQVSKSNDKTHTHDDKQNTPENEYDLPEPPANPGIGGGRTGESESGGNR